MKHNQGPWWVEKTNVENIDFKIIAPGDFGPVATRSVAAVYKNNQHLKRSEANAKLIAAAPTMHDVIKEEIGFAKHGLKDAEKSGNRIAIVMWKGMITRLEKGIKGIE